MTSLYDLRVPGFILNINSRPPTHRGPELTVKNLSLLPSLAVLISLLAAVGLTGCTTAADCYRYTACAYGDSDTNDRLVSTDGHLHTAAHGGDKDYAHRGCPPCGG
jgi:hypothetical protein